MSHKTRTFIWRPRLTWPWHVVGISPSLTWDLRLSVGSTPAKIGFAAVRSPDSAAVSAKRDVFYIHPAIASTLTYKTDQKLPQNLIESFRPPSRPPVVWEVRRAGRQKTPLPSQWRVAGISIAARANRGYTAPVPNPSTSRLKFLHSSYCRSFHGLPGIWTNHK